ncbi:MAG: R3H domain-containing nucleic acid-binding protein [Microgenomates group bacterium]|nr:R3H domain-containing nucleic acid-binding protein [Microgenomates group bacterium]
MDKQKIIKKETEELLKKMINEFEIEIIEEGGIFQVIIKTDTEAPTVIGRYGETIRALQKILEVILYKKLGEPVDILVNVNDYREKQKEKLETLATEAAKKAKNENRPVYLNRLSSFERKIIHEYITDNFPELTSYSVGEGRERKLVIEAKKEEKTNQT